MNYLRANVDNFSIVEYFQTTNAQFRESAEEDFKDLITKVSHFDNTRKNRALFQFATRIRSTNFEILLSKEADEYWSSVLTSATIRKRVYAHLTSEDTIADAILENAQKKLKSKVIETESQGNLDNTTDIWEVWSEIILCMNSDDLSTKMNEFSLERLGIVQLGDDLSNHTIRKLYPPSLVSSSNDVIRTTQFDVFNKHRSFYAEIFELMESSINQCEEHLLKNCMKVKRTDDTSLTFCYQMFLIFVQQVFLLGGLDRLEVVYNYRLLWRMLDVVVMPFDSYEFIPGEVRLESIKKELSRRGLSLQNYYNADGVIIDTEYDLELALLETSGAFGECDNNKKTIDHIKAAYGLLAMLHNVAYKYHSADLSLFKTLKVYFIHAAKDRIRLWSFNLATSKLYVLNRKWSCKVPVNNEKSRQDFKSVVSMMWDLKELLAESSLTIKAIEASHKSNDKMGNTSNLENYLLKTVNVKLPSAVFDIDDIILSSSPLRPASVSSVSTDTANSPDDSNNSDDSDYTVNKH